MDFRKLLHILVLTTLLCSTDWECSEGRSILSLMGLGMLAKIFMPKVVVLPLQGGGLMGGGGGMRAVSEPLNFQAQFQRGLRQFTLSRTSLAPGTTNGQITNTAQMVVNGDQQQANDPQLVPRNNGGASGRPLVSITGQMTSGAPTRPQTNEQAFGNGQNYPNGQFYENQMQQMPQAEPPNTQPLQLHNQNVQAGQGAQAMQGRQPNGQTIQNRLSLKNWQSKRIQSRESGQNAQFRQGGQNTQFRQNGQNTQFRQGQQNTQLRQNRQNGQNNQFGQNRQNTQFRQGGQNTQIGQNGQTVQARQARQNGQARQTNGASFPRATTTSTFVFNRPQSIGRPTLSPNRNTQTNAQSIRNPWPNYKQSNFKQVNVRNAVADNPNSLSVTTSAAAAVPSPTSSPISTPAPLTSPFPQSADEVPTTFQPSDVTAPADDYDWSLPAPNEADQQRTEALTGMVEPFNGERVDEASQSANDPWQYSTQLSSDDLATFKPLSQTAAELLNRAREIATTAMEDNSDFFDKTVIITPSSITNRNTLQELLERAGMVIRSNPSLLLNFGALVNNSPPTNGVLTPNTLPRTSLHTLEQANQGMSNTSQK